MYLVNRFADKEYNKSIKKKGGVELTSGTTKLMAISSQREEELEDPEDCRRSSLTRVLEVLKQCRRQKGGYEAVE